MVLTKGKDAMGDGVAGSRWRAVALGVLCFQGFGIRIFEGVMSGAIAVWFVVLVVLSWRSVRQMTMSYWLKALAIAIFYVLFCLLKGVAVPYFLLVAWASAVVMLTHYYDGRHSFVEDMSRLTKFCMYYSLLHIPIALLFGDNLLVTSFGMNPRTFLYLFFFNHELGIWGLPRIQGFCWEPSCWNLLLNLNLVFVLWHRERIVTVLLAIFAVVTIMSTTGLVAMSVAIILYYLLTLRHRAWARTIVIATLCGLLLFPFVYEDLERKLSIGSGKSRMGDFYIATAVLQHDPWFGGDVDNITDLSYAMEARMEMWDDGVYHEGFMTIGFTNGIASLLVDWGIPMMVVIIVLLFLCPLFDDWRLRFLYVTVLLCVLVGTPVARTGFFYLHPIATILLYPTKRSHATDHTHDIQGS